MLRTFPRAALISAAALCSCTGSRVSDDAAKSDAPPSANATKAARDSSAKLVYEMAAGTWDWAKGDSTCLGNKHEISFSADTREMILTYQQPFDSATGQRIARYRILMAGANVIPSMPYVIRGAMEGETRKDAMGQLVIWDLVLASPNRYHWRVAPAGGTSGALIRCNGTTPLEKWDASQPPGSIR